MPITVQFKETMGGNVAADESDYARGEETGQTLSVHLTITAEDIELFLSDPKHRAAVVGELDWEVEGFGKCAITDGEFDCLVDAEKNSRHMCYRLYFHDAGGASYTLSGVKLVRHDGVEHIWRDTSTLFVKIFRSRTDAYSENAARPIAAGIIRIGILDFMEQLTTFRAQGSSFADEAEAIAKFGTFFLGSLWDVYKPKRGSISSDGEERHIPLFTLRGVHNAEITSHYFSTADHLGLNMLRFQRRPSQEIVVLLHGLTTSTDMFIMPEHYNIVNYLLDHGYTDVWSLDWRGSNRYSYDLFPAHFTMDDIALYDMPAAFSKIRQVVGREACIHVICHCVGSLTFLMSLYAGLIDGITSVISNSLSLTPRVPTWSRMKLTIAPKIVPGAMDLNPRWSKFPGISLGKILARLVSLAHPECNVPACHMVSFMWGSGRPAVWMHKNLHQTTHLRTGDLFGPVNINYFPHVRKMVAKGVAVKMYPNDPRYDLLPNDYLDGAEKINTPILFVMGNNNRVFQDSNEIAFNTLRKLNPNQQNELRIFPDYGHQDIFMGKNSHHDVFPVFLDFLKRHSCERAVESMLAKA